MIEISRNEQFFTEPKLLSLIYDYETDFPYTMWTYSLEEIVCEKLRAILQNTQKLHEVGWTRSRSRDYYDLWRILTYYGDSLNREEILAVLPYKCAIKDVSWKTSDDFFQESYIKGIRASWEKWLAPLVADLPPCEDVLAVLKVLLNELLLSKPSSQRIK